MTVWNMRLFSVQAEHVCDTSFFLDRGKSNCCFVKAPANQKVRDDVSDNRMGMSARTQPNCTRDVVGNTRATREDVLKTEFGRQTLQPPITPANGPLRSSARLQCRRRSETSSSRAQKDVFECSARWT